MSVAAGLTIGHVALALSGPTLARRARSRRRRAAWLAATRTCRRALPFWLLLAIGVLGAWSNGAGAPDLLATVAGAGATGAQLLLVAGRIEARGRIGTGCALARLGGQVLFAGAAAFVLLGGFSHLVAALAVGLGGIAALLAGLAGKPRPSGPIVIGLYALGLVALALAG